MASTLIIPLPSGIINALVFLFFDFLLLTLFASVLQSLQWRSVRRRFRSKEIVTVSDSVYGPLAIGIRDDHTVRHHVLVLVHFTFLLLLFLHTLGIKGRSSFKSRSVVRSFVTTVSANESSLGVDRISVRKFSGCSVQHKSSILYYPLAFVTNPPRIVVDPVGLRDKNGLIVPFNQTSFLCQTSSSAPLVAVPSCGQSALECNSLKISPSVRIIANRAQQPYVNSIFKAAGNSPSVLVFHLSARLENVSKSGQQLFESYDRLICRQIPDREFGTIAPGTANFNCLLGLWNDDASLFTFRLGSAITAAGNITTEEWKERANSGFLVTFVATTAQMSVEWSAKVSGEAIFADSLFALKTDRLTAHAFLDLLVERAVVPTLVDSTITDIREEMKFDVTDIHIGAIVGYVALFIVVVTLAVWLQFDKEGKENNILTWNGLFQILQDTRDAQDTEPDGTSFVSMNHLRELMNPQRIQRDYC